MMPFPVYLLRETPDMKEWLLLVAHGVHFRLLLHSFLRVKKPEVTPRFHFQFADSIPDMESLLLPLLRGAGYQPSALQSDAEFWREVMEQASKRSSSHEGGLLLDPLHKGTRFPSVCKDREDRQQQVSAQLCSSVSSFHTTNRIFLTGYFF
jgi:hypothetical protein